ncbi:MAG TPA: hypothetical protein VII73_08215 [Caulobacteraceae bacterium]
MKTWLPSLVGIALLFTASAAGAAGAAVPLAQLSLQERQDTAPASTIVQVGKLSLTLGQLRAAHAAREAALSRARFSGLQAAGALRAGLAPGARGMRAGGIAREPIWNHPAGPAAGPRGMRPGGIARGPVGNLAATTLVVESPTQYASAPADMKAFCSSASVSACLFLPPQQQLSVWPGGLIADFDPLIDQPQCGSEGGYWASMFGGPAECGFYYPSSVVVHFTPASNYHVASTASCASSTWTYQVDDHGAIAIQILPQLSSAIDFSTGNSATCVVSVTLG